MRIYHGTTETVARAALTQGLAPRAHTQTKGNWEACPSNEKAIYLTDAYAGYFAACASDEGSKWGLVEIETERLDRRLLVPDEDWLEQATRGQKAPPEWGLNRLRRMESRTRWFRQRLEAFAHLWTESIEGLGNCAYLGAIPASAVTRVCVFDPRANPMVAMACLDPIISLMNYRIVGDKYRALTALMFASDEDAAEAHGRIWRWDLGFLPPGQVAEVLQAVRDRSAFAVLEAA